MQMRPREYQIRQMIDANCNQWGWKKANGAGKWISAIVVLFEALERFHLVERTKSFDLLVSLAAILPLSTGSARRGQRPLAGHASCAGVTVNQTPLFLELSPAR